MPSSGVRSFLRPFFLFVLCGATGLSFEYPAVEDPAPNVPKPDVYSLHVTSTIRYRYAQTLVTSRVANPANVSQEVTFHVVLPETAFITGFVMIIKEKEYRAYVKEKEEAKAEYDHAVSTGQAAAHVAYSARDSNQFTVSINVEPLSKVTFNLTYEELLDRVLSTYKHEININPGQIVKEMSVEVDIQDISPIINLKVPDLKMTNELKEVEGDNPLAKITKSEPEKANIQWAPTVDEQKELNSEGIKGQFVVQFDVDRTNSPQQILVDEGYFIHFFAQDDLPPLNKHVVFVLDLSGSMHGRKLQQVKEAMNKILSDLNSKDYFSLVLFSDSAKAWAPNKIPTFAYSFNRGSTVSADEELTNEYIVAVNSTNIEAAKTFINELDDLGGTNIIAGLRMGLKLTKIGNELLMNLSDKPEPILIFLTDGEPNVEMSDPNEITKTAKSLNSLRSAIFSLGFGDGADMKFLRNLSLANSGFARNIYEGADATLQLKNFFKEVASPLLANVTFQYLPDQVENDTTKVHFDTLFSGSELVVAGKLVNDSLSGALVARSPNGETEFPFSEIRHVVIDFIPPIPTPANKTYGHLERMWAYKSISQLLDKNLVEQNETIKKEALELALKYSFVTPLTSLVVVKPNETTAVDAEKSSLEPPLHHHSRLTAGRRNLLFRHNPVSIKQTSTQLVMKDSVAGSNFYFAAPIAQMSAPGMSANSAAGFAGGAASYFPPPVPLAGLAKPTFFASTTSKMPGSKIDNLEISSLEYTTANSFLEDYSDVEWLRELSFSPDNQTLHVPESLSTDVIALNVTDEALFSCSANNIQGDCRHFVHCVLRSFLFDVNEYKPYMCHIEPNFLGVCCPHSVKN